MTKICEVCEKPIIPKVPHTCFPIPNEVAQKENPDLAECITCGAFNPRGDSCHTCDGRAAIKSVILEEAGSITSGARRQQYGPPERNFERIASYWNVYFMNTGRSVLITPGDVSKMMRLMKEARLDETPDHYDSFVDIVGYALTEAETRSVKKPE